MSAPAHTDLQAALDAERAKCVALQAEIERLRGLLRREQQARHAALAEVDRITEAGRVHIRRAAAFEAQRDELAEALVELSDRIRGHPAYADLTEDQEMRVGGDTAELSYLARVADAALSAMRRDERRGSA